MKRPRLRFRLRRSVTAPSILGVEKAALLAEREEKPEVVQLQRLRTALRLRNELEPSCHEELPDEEQRREQSEMVRMRAALALRSQIESKPTNTKASEIDLDLQRMRAALTLRSESSVSSEPCTECKQSAADEAESRDLVRMRAALRARNQTES